MSDDVTVRVQVVRLFPDPGEIGRRAARPSRSEPVIQPAVRPRRDDEATRKVSEFRKRPTGIRKG